jgi:hypothetical protein
VVLGEEHADHDRLLGISRPSVILALVQAGDDIVGEGGHVPHRCHLASRPPASGSTLLVRTHPDPLLGWPDTKPGNRIRQGRTSAGS